MNFSPLDQFPLPQASWGIGHVRYSTIGAGNIKDIQPQFINHTHPIAIVHNGNIVNYVPLKNELMCNQVVFETTSDTEVILQLFARTLSKECCDFEDICRAVGEVYQHIFGAYSIVGIIAGVGMVAFRDPWGFRPLLHGKSQDGNMHIFASETGPLASLDMNTVNDVDPGEVIFIDRHSKIHRRHLKKHVHTHCSFEFNYFAKPNAIIENRDVYRIRSQLGEALAVNVKKNLIDADIVVPIPETARPSAISLARSLNLPFEEGFVKQDHIGRTFILPTQGIRKKKVMQKLSAIPSVFKNKRILLVDDSIVRGTVSKKVIHLARKAGASKVYFASTYPPIRYPCVYGIDFPQQEQLIAWGKSLEEIGREIGADGLVYNSVEDLKKAIGIDDLCTACLTGEYPTKIDGLIELQKLRHSHLCQLEGKCTV